MNQKYSTNEHLKGKNRINFLFEQGLWVTKYPLKIIYCAKPNPSTHHIAGVSVSKRNFKRAVDRNYIKRLLRECYRLHKNELNEILLQPHILMIIYTGKDILSFPDLKIKYLQIIEKMKNSE